MTKEREVLSFLYRNLFNDVLSSGNITNELKKNIQDTVRALNDRSAEGMVRYFWSNIGGEENRRVLAQRLKDEGFLGFDKMIQGFKVRFNGEWLRE